MDTKSSKSGSWRNKNYSFFRHEKCEYFPCHKTDNKEEFNCLFCYCPLYPLKDRCGGNFAYHNGIKDCSDCVFPHQRQNYGYIIRRFGEIAAIAELKAAAETKGG